MNKQFLQQEFSKEKAEKTLVIGKILALGGLPIIGTITYLEYLTFQSTNLIVCRLLFLLPALTFLILAQTIFINRPHLIIPFHALTVSGGVAMMVAITLVKYHINNIFPAYVLASVNGGLIIAIFVMYTFSAGARIYLKYSIGFLLSVLCIYFLVIEKLTWLEASPLVNPLIGGMGVIFLSIYTEALEYKEFRMRKLAEIRKYKLEEEIEEKALLEDKLRQQATIDELTEVFNRRACYDLLNTSLTFSKENQTSLTICYMDLDNLKKINDTYGHLEGDNILISFASFFKQSIREEDYICRIGGDEFLLILNNCTEENATKIIERLRTQIKEIIDYPEFDFSYGISQYIEDTDFNICQLIDLADRNMYKKKMEKKEVINL